MCTTESYTRKKWPPSASAFPILVLRRLAHDFNESKQFLQPLTDEYLKFPNQFVDIPDNYSQL